MVLIRKIRQPIGTVSELYIDKKMVSFAYDTLPEGEGFFYAGSTGFTEGNEAQGRYNITVPKGEPWTLVNLMREAYPDFKIEVLEKWALKA
jgi:hypothetical protein